MKAFRFCYILILTLLFADLQAQERTFVDVYVDDMENGFCYFYDVDEVRVHGISDYNNHAWMWMANWQFVCSEETFIISKTDEYIGVFRYFGDGNTKDFGVFFGSNYMHFDVGEVLSPSFNTDYFCPDLDGVVLHAEDTNVVFQSPDPLSYLFHNMVMAVVTPSTSGDWFFCDPDYVICNPKRLCISAGIPPTEPWTQSQLLKCQGIDHLYAQTDPQDDYTYLWTSGETTPFIDITELGTYGVTVTDACGNTVTDQVTITGEYPEHAPSLPANTYFCEGGSVTLDPGSGFQSYLWSDSTQGATLTVTEPGVYWVQTVNEYGCEGLASTTVSYLTPPLMDGSSPMVTADTLTMSGNNMLCWNDESPYIDEVKVFREGMTNQWDLVGSADYHDKHFIDAVSSNERTYRYKLSAIDMCGDESELGRSYQTMNAAYLGPGVDGTYWVQWTPYKVADVNNSVSRYELWTADNLTDFNTRIVDEPVLYDSYFGYYYVNLPHGIQDSIFFVRAYVKPQYGGGTVMSNFVENYEILDVNDDFIEAAVFRVYPNPSNGTFTVEGEGRLKVFNHLGQTVIERDIDGKTTLTLPSGMYLIRLVNGTINETRKVVVE